MTTCKKVALKKLAKDVITKCPDFTVAEVAKAMKRNTHLKVADDFLYTLIDDVMQQVEENRYNVSKFYK